MNPPSTLRPFFEPQNIALFGASPEPGTLGYGIWSNFQNTRWQNKLHCINPRHEEVHGQRCVPTLADVAARIDLALITTPWSQVDALLQDCHRHGVRAAVLYGANTGPVPSLPGRAQGPLRLWGPRALGYALPHRNIHMLALHKSVPTGHLGFVSQSNAVCAAVLDWQHNEEFGFSAVFCPGQGADADLPELIDFLATDVHTESILLYLEGVRDARRFLSAVRAAASVKPVVVVKAGLEARTQPLVARHLELPVGDDAVFDAALRRCGALRVASIGDMFSAARALGNARKPRGNRLALISNGGGPLVMAADAAARHKVALACTSADTAQELHRLNPLSWSTGNPVDVLFDADTQRYTAALRTLLDDPQVDGVVSILTPNTFVDPLAVAEATIEVAHRSSKPVLGCWLGEIQVRQARARFAKERIAGFRTPESAVVGFGFLVDWVHSQAQLQETPAAMAATVPPDVERARAILQAAALAPQCTALPRVQSQALLASFHIACVEAHPTAYQAAAIAEITLWRDPVFGPVLGLRLCPTMAPMRCALPPLNARLAQQLCQDCGLGDMPASGDAVQAVLLRLSEMASELSGLQSVHLRCNPLGQVQDPHIEVYLAPRHDPQYPHMAICPYPQQFTHELGLRKGLRTTIRPIRPEDAAALQTFVRALSQRSKYYRFFNALHELPTKMLVRYTQIDYAREMTLVALAEVDGHTTMVGEANYATLADSKTCEFAVVVADAMAGQGLGSALMSALMDTARAFGLQRIEGEVLANNQPMIALMESLGFDVYCTDDDTVEVARSL